ncbi:MAG TPA: recombinase family protein [Crenalkalicoccus sp.]|nr:recombinase family protein [Crenalkalicoccus sp.]
MALPEKIQGRHHDRLAIVYVRQSTLRQVEQNQESTRLQYGLVERALQLGWARERVEVIDDDLGRSGSTTAHRPGFQRLVAEVGLDHVGLVLGVEMSRLARSCRDWHQLLEICALFGTLLADTDGVYDPAGFNDRLLLGLKGTISEAELHVLKARMLEGRRAKAERGELLFNLPRGYVRDRAGAIGLDSDEQVQAVVRLVFDTFERRHTINGVLSYLVAHDIQLPFRARSGTAKGELEWHAPNRHTLSEMLQSPLYAGAYAYGRRRVDQPAQGSAQSASGPRTTVPAVLIKGRLPAYISWETYERNLRQVAANQSAHRGIPRGGPALLAGLLVCGRCSQRMAAQYPNGGRFQRYNCSRLSVNYGGPTCQSLSGRALDALVAELMLQALAPGSLAVSLQLAEDLELERTALHRQWRQRLERARYEVERARRQYDAAEPENRLVVRTLEQRWEAALSEEIRLAAEHERFLAEQPLPLTPGERAAIERLASDIPALWSAPSTTAADRQAIARLMLDRVVVTVQGESERVAVECHWAGGQRTQHDLRRPVARLTQLSEHGALLLRTRDLHEAGQKAPAIATALNAEGWLPPKRRLTFTTEMVRGLLRRQGILAFQRRSPASRLRQRETTELTIPEAAARLGMPENTLYRWMRRGLVSARKVQVLGHGLWLIRADQAELNRLRQRREQGAARSTAHNAS